MICGKKIFLRQVEETDLERLRDWRNTERIRGVCREYRLLNMENQKQYFNSLTNNKDSIMFIIENQRHKPIGVCGLTPISWVYRKAEVSLYIGDIKNTGKGYAKDTLETLLQYGFLSLGMHRIYVTIYGFNDISICLFESCGFRREGVCRDAYYYNGEYHDEIVFSILRREYDLL